MMRMVSKQLEDQLRRRYSPVHVAARLAQLDEIGQHARAQRDRIDAAAQQLGAALAGRFWLPPELAGQWQGAHAHSLAVLDNLLARLQLCQAGFAALPQDAALPARMPEPITLPA
jgi:MoxR-like ATPase